MTTTNIHHSEHLGLFGKLTKIFLKNKELSILTMVVIAAWGLLSFFLTPKQYNPEIVAPAFNIVTEFPNASAEEVHEFITRPMEDKLSELPEVDEISSRSEAGGKSSVMVKFFVGADAEKSKTTLNQKLRDNINLKPLGALEPVIQSIDPDDVPILDLGLASDELSESSLRKLAQDLADELKLVPGISKVEIKGGRINHFEIELDVKQLAAHEISADEVSRAIADSNSIYTVDLLKNADRNTIINFSGNIENATDLEKIILRQDQGALLRLQDIAKIHYGPGEITNYVRLAKKDSPEAPIVHLALSKLKGTNSTTVAQKALAKLDDLENRQILGSARVEVLRNEGRTASEEIKKLTGNLMQSIAIVGLVLFVFLGLRNAAIVAISIPLTLLAVFIIGNLAGQTINRITLFALILSLGLLVDNATVVVENINRLRRERKGERLGTVIVRAVDEVGSGLFMSTLTTLLAFFPMAFVTGMMGPYMGPIPFFVPAALVASLLIALTVNPFLAFLFATKNGQAKEQNNFLIEAIRALEKKYANFLDLLLTRKKIRVLVLLATLFLFLVSLGLPLLKIVPFRMLPKADKEQFYLTLDLPQGTNIEKTDSVSHAFENKILQQEHILGIESFIGESQVIDFNGLFRGSADRHNENQATLKINLTHPTERSETSEEIAYGLRQQLLQFRKEYPDAVFRLVEDPPGPPVLSTFLLKVRGGNEETREKIAKDLYQEIRNIKEVVDIDTSIPERSVNGLYKIQTDKASLLGISSQEIATALRAALSGTPLGLYHRAAEDGTRQPEQEYIRLRFAKGNRDQQTDLAKIHVRSQNGEMVPLTELLEKREGSLETFILSDERERATYISAEMGDRSIIYAIFDLFPKLFAYELPDQRGRIASWSPLKIEYEDQRNSERYSVSIDGEWKLTLEVFRDLGLAMAVAIFLIYFVLVAQFRSAVTPLLIMATIPLALIGVLPGFALLSFFKGTYFNATSMIGVIALAGIVVNNAIIYLEYLFSLRKEKRPLKESLILAGRTRLLPIMLTSVTTILGSLTIVSDPVWEGLAWSIIFGLSISTFLTLIIFPILYFMVEGKNWEREAHHEKHF